MQRVLCALVVALAVAAALDCDELHGNERTACLDKAAEQNIQMMPAENEDPAVKLQQEEQDAETGQDDEPVDDVMGDLGEAAKTTAKTGVSTEMAADLQEAKRKTAHMYDDDIKVAKAFAGLDDEMDDLKMHLGALHTSMQVEDSASQVREEYDREEEEEEASKERDLGESDNVKAKVEDENPLKLPEQESGLLTANEDDLAKDLHVGFETYTPDTMDKADNLMAEMQGKEAPVPDVAMLDESTEFLQFSGEGKGLESMDLAHSDDSLMSRAQMEARQSEIMSDDDDLSNEAHDLGDTVSDEDKMDNDLDDFDMTVADQPDLDIGESKGRSLAESVVEGDEHSQTEKSAEDIGSMAQHNAVEKANEFVSDEDKREEAAIKKAQDREKKMEDDAKSTMYAEMQKMKHETEEDKSQLGESMKSHKREGKVAGEVEA